MAYWNIKILSLVLIWLYVLYNNRIEGSTSIEAEGRQTVPKDGRYIEAHPSRIISNLFSNITDDQFMEYNAHHAGWFSPSHNFHGTRARISVWEMQNVTYNSQSAVYITILNEDGKDFCLVAGFHVYPNLYSGNADLRLFAGWKTGEGKDCFSINCDGFILSGVNGAPKPGDKFEPLSTYGGKDYFVTLKIKKDERTLDWSLYRDDNDDPILIGWWPKTLFNNTFDSATRIAWGAGVVYPKNETSPPMGSGHFASEGANKAAYISHIKIFNEFGFMIDVDVNKAGQFTDRFDCYKTTGLKYRPKKGNHFYYGGPSGCKD